MEFSLLFAALMGMLAMWAMLWWEAKRGNAADCARNLWDVALTAAVVGLFVGRLAAMIGDGVNPLTNPKDIIIIRGGVATGWASLAAVTTVAVMGGRERWIVADGLSAAALAGLAGWHSGCLARDACLGTSSDLPWALTQEGSAVARHPVELYAAVLLAIGALGLAAWKARGRPPLGAPAAAALAIAGGVRLVTEPMRLALSTGPVLWYGAAFLVGTAAVIILLWRKRTSRAAAAATPPAQPERRAGP